MIRIAFFNNKGGVGKTTLVYHVAQTILGCIRPILRGLGDIQEPHVESLRDGLAVVPGDLGLSSFEDKLSNAWPRALDRDEAAFRTLSAFHRVATLAAERQAVDVVLTDVGPNLGAINRAALLAVDFVVTPLAPDLYSIQGLRNLGPTLLDWRAPLARAPREEP